MIESLVSVVIPNFNHSDQLGRAVRSALIQRYLHEIIIIDDASTDDSAAVGESLCQLDSRVAFFRQAQNLGPASARNLGVMYATGHYVAFLDADDEYLPDFLESAVTALEATLEMRAVKVWAEFFDEDSGMPLLENSDPRVEALVFSSPSNVVMERDAFWEIGGFSENTVFREGFGGEDVAFCKALAQFLEPLGRIEKVGYRVWGTNGDHLDRFLKNTQVHGREFSFSHVAPEQLPGGKLDLAIGEYLDEIAQRLRRNATSDASEIT